MEFNTSDMTKSELEEEYFDITFASPGHPDDTIGIIGMYHQFHRFLSALGYTQNTIRSVAAEATQDIELTT